MRNHNIKNKIQDLKILIVGDIMLDIFRYGNISRMSQEAPVPVLDIDREYFHPGGALNVCRNVRSLGADCRIISLTGQDSERNTILDLCRKYDIPVKNLFSDPSRPTTVKSRV